MNREYHAWHSPYLDREMELLVFGHAGVKVLVFPTRGGRFYEYENLRIVESLRPQVEAGEMQLYCVDGIDRETFYSETRTPPERIARHIEYEKYVLHEVMPLMAAKNDNPVTIAHGCSLGAFQAANIAFRHPHLFQKLVAFSGRYDPTMSVEFFNDLLDGYRSEDVYYHTPVAYLPDLDGWRLEALRKMEIVLVIGLEDPFLENNRYLSQILWQKGVHHTLDEWEERAHRGYYWRRMAPLYVKPPLGKNPPRQDVGQGAEAGQGTEAGEGRTSGQGSQAGHGLPAAQSVDAGEGVPAAQRADAGQPVISEAADEVPAV